MRISLIVCFAALPLLPAYAAMPVTDYTAIARDAEEAAQTLSELQTQYRQLVSTYDALAHPLNTIEMATGLSDGLTRNSMPSVGNVENLLSGAATSPLSQRLTQQNQYYAPTGTDFQAAEMQRQQQSTMNVQAMAETNLQSLQDRMSGLSDLQGEIDGAKTIEDVNGIQARLGSEQNYVATQQAQASQLQLLLATQSRTDTMRQDQKARQDAEQQAQDTGGFNAGATLDGPTWTAPAPSTNVPTWSAGAATGG